MTDSKDRVLGIHPHVLAVFWGALPDREIRPGDMPQDDSVLFKPAPAVPVVPARPR
jgi:hypothetical protein